MRWGCRVVAEFLSQEEEDRISQEMKHMSWVWYTGEEWNIHYLPSEPGVYAILDGNKVLYVGSSQNLKKRISCHSKLLKTLPDGKYKFSCSRRYGDWLMREVRLIRRLRPKLNVRGKK